MKHLRLQLFAIVPMLLLLTSCEAVTPELSGLQAAKRKWEKHGLERYTYQLQTSGPFQPSLMVVVNVDQGVVTSIQDAFTGGPAYFPGDTIPLNRTSHPSLLSIKEWFERIENDHRDSDLELSFHDSLGYPNRVDFVDHSGGDAIQWNVITNVR